MSKRNPRNLLIILGDQLDHESPIFENADPKRDIAWMAEVAEETEHVWCHQLRVAFFFSAMRHFAEELRAAGWEVRYRELPEDAGKDNYPSFEKLLTADLQELKPDGVRVVQPGDLRVEKQLLAACDSAKCGLSIMEDAHFYCGIEEFATFAEGRKELVMETFYRQMRRKHKVLMQGSKPAGGEWNFDKENRETFGKKGPSSLPAMPVYEPDAISNKVLKLVAKRFAKHPGSLEHFVLPVTRAHALEFLEDFLTHRLPLFGKYEDAMWGGEAFLYHSRISALLNVKLLNPRECVEMAVARYEEGRAPINSVEGFVRQILGWREFIRGVYWLKMPGYLELNALDAQGDVPDFFWDGKTDMACARDSMRHVIDHGYSHHIQRLMVLGQYAMLSGVHPRKFHEWHMAMYLDAVDWVSLPNTLGMSQYGDGGIVGTKPYCASGKYIQRMGNFCAGCKFDPGIAIGENACPFTALYWDFLDRHREKFTGNMRMGFQIKNLERKSDEELAEIRETAGRWRAK